MPPVIMLRPMLVSEVVAMVMAGPVIPAKEAMPPAAAEQEVQATPDTAVEEATKHNPSPPTA